MRIAVVNAGSATIKAALLEQRALGLQEIFRGEADWAGKEAEAVATRLLEEMPAAPEAVGHRVVHGGSIAEPLLPLETGVEAVIEEMAPRAPLHNPPALAAIRAARRAFPGASAWVSFDTAFHARRPAVSMHYALPPALAKERNFYRHGFHGIAHAGLAASAARAEGVDADAIDAVTLQLGAGCSACAIRAGRSVETSMGCTPLEGLMMLTRCGDIDPAIVLDLLRGGMDAEQVEALLTRQSGLTGMAGRHDMREILADEARGDAAAQLAVGLFIYRIVLEAGAYLTLLQGQGVLVFGGGIGANSPVIRERVCAGLAAWNIRLDPEANAAGREGRISRDGRPVYLFKTAEERVIAEAIARRLAP